jgi:1-acyl-sn-glycerol-3-phosphate acyltransferase
MGEPITREVTDVGQLTRHLSEEILNALGLSQTAWVRRLLRPAAWLPAHRFAELAVAFEQRVTEQGVPAAADWLLHRLVAGARIEGQEGIPAAGPLVVVSNHPGSVDAVAIASSLPRNDLKVVATGVPFFQTFRVAREHLLLVPREGPGRSTTLRGMLRHLESGGSLMLFPGGNVEPDPAFLPGAREALARWSPSVELLLRRLPDTQVLPTIVSGVLSPRWLRHPLVRRLPNVRDRQRLAEFLMGIQQFVLGQRQRFMPDVTFGQPFTAGDLAGGESLMSSLIEQVQRLLEEHVEARSLPRTQGAAGS